MKIIRWLSCLLVIGLWIHLAIGSANAIPIADVTASLSGGYTLTPDDAGSEFGITITSFETYVWGAVDASADYELEFEGANAPVTVTINDSSGSLIEARSPDTNSPTSVFSKSISRLNTAGYVTASSAAVYTAYFTATGSGTLNFSLLFNVIMSLTSSGSDEGAIGDAGYEVVFSLYDDSDNGYESYSTFTGSYDSMETYPQSFSESLALAAGDKGSLDFTVWTYGYTYSVPEPLTVSLLGFGLVGLAMFGKSRRRIAS